MVIAVSTFVFLVLHFRSSFLQIVSRKMAMAIKMPKCLRIKTCQTLLVLDSIILIYFLLS